MNYALLDDVLFCKCSFLLCTILYAGVAAAGFLMFGESIKSQFTLNMPQQYLSSKLAVWTTVHIFTLAQDIFLLVENVIFISIYQMFSLNICL